MKKLISMFVVLVMMFAALPISSCSDKEEEVLESLKEHSIEGLWLVAWSSENMYGQTLTIEITKDRICIFSDGIQVDYYKYTMGGNMLTLGDAKDPEGYITIDVLTAEYAEIKIRSEWIDGTCKMELRRLD